MKKYKKHILSALVIAGLLVSGEVYAQLSGGGNINTSNLWKRISNYIIPAGDWNIGSSADRVSKIWADDGDFTTLSFSGVASGSIGLPDDTSLNLGDSDDASIVYDTTDPNANSLKIGTPDGDATNSPYIHVGRASDINGVDLAIGNGATRPRLIFWDNALSKRMEMGWGSTYFEIGGGSGAHQVQILTTLNTTQVITANDSPIVFGATNQGSIRRNTVYGDDDWRYTTNTEPIIFGSYNNVETGYGKGVVTRPTIYLTSETSWGTSTDEWGRFQHDTNDFLIESGKGDITLNPANYIVLKSDKAETGDPTGEEGMIYFNTFDNVLKIYADGAWRTITTW